MGSDPIDFLLMGPDPELQITDVWTWNRALKPTAVIELSQLGLAQLAHELVELNLAKLIGSGAKLESETFQLGLAMGAAEFELNLLRTQIGQRWL